MTHPLIAAALAVLPAGREIDQALAIPMDDHAAAQENIVTTSIKL